jgi:hypothetical protein
VYGWHSQLTETGEKVKDLKQSLTVAMMVYLTTKAHHQAILTPLSQATVQML